MRLFSICTNPILIVSLGMIMAIFHRLTFFYFCWFFYFYFFLVFLQVFVFYSIDKAFPGFNLFTKFTMPLIFPHFLFFLLPEKLLSYWCCNLLFPPYTEVEEQALQTSQLCILYYTVSKSEQIPNEPCKTKTRTLCLSYRISFQWSVSEGLPEVERMELIIENWYIFFHMGFSSPFLNPDYHKCNFRIHF